MQKTLRFGSALSAIAAASMIGGCATPQTGARSASIFGGKVDKSNIGVATRALAAMNAKNYDSAINHAERAVENSPRDAGFRALLGTAYFSAGRFASAESALLDSLALISNQPQVVLKAALAQIAQGKNAEAVAFLGAARDVLDPADYGLALALAGQPGEAINVLQPAAREVGADARLRQNLALAYALSGDWAAARTIAAQDLSADLVDARIQQWMTFAKPVAAADQVASLTGVTPAATDAGQPTRLALRDVPTRTAEAAPVIVPEAAPVAEAAAVAVPAPEPQLAYLAPAEPVAQPAVEVAAAPEPAPAFVQADPVYVEPAPVRARPPVLTASVTKKLPPARPAALPRRNGRSTAVLQLGAYGSPQRVAAAWAAASRRYSALNRYAPVSARFNSAKGLVYRLSVKGFESPAEAARLCLALRKGGGSCFVRSVAGDAPVRLASR